MYTYKKIQRKGWRGAVDSMFSTSIGDYEIYKNNKKTRTLRNWSSSYAQLLIDVLNDEFNKRG